MFLPHPRVKVSIAGNLRGREVACLASDRQGSNFESCVWRTESSQSSHHPQKVLLAQFSIYVHKGGLKPDSFHFLLCSLDNVIQHSVGVICIHFIFFVCVKGSNAFRSSFSLVFPVTGNTRVSGILRPSIENDVWS